MSTPTERTRPYLEAIIDALDTTRITYDRDDDVSGEDASHFLMVYTPTRPGIHLFISVHWYGQTSGRLVTTTACIQDSATHDPILEYGDLIIVGASPLLVASCVGEFARTFAVHGRI